jgi:hypothetical protein
MASDLRKFSAAKGRARNMFAQTLSDKDSHTPDRGFNVVIVDDFEPPGEQLATKSHHETRGEAEKAAAEYRAEAHRKAKASRGTIIPEFLILGHD